MHYVKLVSRSGRGFRKFFGITKFTKGEPLKERSEGKSGRKIALKSEADFEKILSSNKISPTNRQGFKLITFSITKEQWLIQLMPVSALLKALKISWLKY